MSEDNIFKDEVYDVYWEGPYGWGYFDMKEKHHVLYALYGTHPVYGPKSLLYIGQTTREDPKRLGEHDRWVQDESDDVCFYLASIGEFENWTDWKKPGDYDKADLDLVTKIEKLLIHAHQPAYNSQSLGEPAEFYPIRIFNSGKSGVLLPECSYRYYRDEEDI